MSEAAPLFDESLHHYLADPLEAAAYLDASLEAGDSPALLLALRDVVTARGGMGNVADTAGLSHEALLQALSKEEDLTLDALSKVLAYTGLRLTVVPARESQETAG